MPIRWSGATIGSVPGTSGVTEAGCPLTASATAITRWTNGWSTGVRAASAITTGDGEPEVIVDFYTGGAHCCVVTAFYRWDGGAYRRSTGYFGNYGYKIVDLDHDGTTELSAYDERFAYAFGSYADSLSPPVVWHWQAGKLVDVTKSFPALAQANAKLAFKLFTRSKRRHDDIAARAVLAAWAADQC